MRPPTCDAVLRVRLPAPLLAAVARAAARELEPVSAFARRALLAAARRHGLEPGFDEVLEVRE